MMMLVHAASLSAVGTFYLGRSTSERSSGSKERFRSSVLGTCVVRKRQNIEFFFFLIEERVSNLCVTVSYRIRRWWNVLHHCATIASRSTSESHDSRISRFRPPVLDVSAGVLRVFSPLFPHRELQRFATTNNVVMVSSLPTRR